MRKYHIKVGGMHNYSCESEEKQIRTDQKDKKMSYNYIFIDINVSMYIYMYIYVFMHIHIYVKDVRCIHVSTCMYTNR
jgi:hypothetical protein